jgi:acetyl-CoA decarbonylase/synthase complex subunit delta
MAAMAQGDDKLQMPIINNLGNEVWKCKEAKQTLTKPRPWVTRKNAASSWKPWGPSPTSWPAADILIMRHPEAIRLVKAFIDLAMDGGSAADIAPIAKRLEGVDP